MSVRAFIVVMLVPAIAAAAHRSDKAHQSELGQGMALFTSGDFRGALAHFNDALGEANGSAETAHVHLLRGECYSALSDEPDARRAFELALDQDPDAKLDPNQVAPETVELLKRVRDGLHAQLTVEGEGATATLDGKPLGALPIHQAIPIGTHELEVANTDRGFDQKQTLLARPGDALSLKFEVPAAVATTTKPATANVTTRPSNSATPKNEVEAPAQTGLDVFGQLGAMADPASKGFAFEAGGGVGYGAFIAGASAVVGSSPGASFRAGGRLRNLLGLVGVEASAELPVFFDSGVQAGVGARAGISVAFSLLEPYVDVRGEHFFSAPAGFPENYFLAGVGLRVHAP